MMPHQMPPNCFHFTPIPILSTEACLSPIFVIASHKCRMAPLRLICTASIYNPATARLSPTFLLLLRCGASDSYCSLYTKLLLNVMLLSWHTNCPTSKVRSHLPIDQLTNIALLQVGALSYTLIANAHLLPDLPILPSADIIKATYCTLGGRTQAIIGVE